MELKEGLIMEEIYETTYIFNPSLMRYEKVKETVVDYDWDDCCIETANA